MKIDRPWRIGCPNDEKGRVRGAINFAADSRMWTGCGFDELVVGDWLHIERMNPREWWMRLGQKTYWITVKSKGDVKLFDQQAGVFIDTGRKPTRSQSKRKKGARR